jgi:chaperonin cofactor prefoldin
MAAPNPQAKAKDTANLQQALRKLNTQRATIDATIQAASRSLSAHASPPKLPG